jgi:hypothetical protein
VSTFLFSLAVLSRALFLSRGPAPQLCSPVLPTFTLPSLLSPHVASYKRHRSLRFPERRHVGTARHALLLARVVWVTAAREAARSCSSCRAPGVCGAGAADMSCLGWFKRRSRKGRSSSSGKRGASSTATVSVSGPATATATTTTTASAESTSRSDDSGAVRPVSKSAGSSQSQRSISSLYEERGHGQLRVFDYDELQGATAEFGRAQKLGEGGFGSVYKGFIRAADGKGDRVPVAVKKLNQRGMQVRVRPYVCVLLFVLTPSLPPPVAVSLVGLSARAFTCHR